MLGLIMHYISFKMIYIASLGLKGGGTAPPPPKSTTVINS